MLPSTLAESSGDALVVLPLPALRPDHTARAAALLASSSTALSTSSSTSSANVAAAAGLRSANRAAQSGLNASRARAADARVQADAADVALRTAEYELARVRDETAKCAAYEPLYERLEFVSEEEFMAGAGEEVVGAFREYNSDSDSGLDTGGVMFRLPCAACRVLL